jgi:hypothetical protein
LPRRISISHSVAPLVKVVERSRDVAEKEETSGCV